MKCEFDKLGQLYYIEKNCTPWLLLKCEMISSRIENGMNYADILKSNHRNSFASFRWEILFIYVFLVEFQKLISLKNLKLITKKEFFAKVKVPIISDYIFFVLSSGNWGWKFQNPETWNTFPFDCLENRGFPIHVPKLF